MFSPACFPLLLKWPFLSFPLPFLFSPFSLFCLMFGFPCFFSLLTHLPFLCSLYVCLLSFISFTVHILSSFPIPSLYLLFSCPLLCSVLFPHLCRYFLPLDPLQVPFLSFPFLSGVLTFLPFLDFFTSFFIFVSFPLFPLLSMLSFPFLFLSLLSFYLLFSCPLLLFLHYFFPSFLLFNVPFLSPCILFLFSVPHCLIPRFPFVSSPLLPFFFISFPALFVLFPLLPFLSLLSPSFVAFPSLPPSPFPFPFSSMYISPAASPPPQQIRQLLSPQWPFRSG